MKHAPDTIVIRPSPHEWVSPAFGVCAMTLGSVTAVRDDDHHFAVFFAALAVVQLVVLLLSMWPHLRLTPSSALTRGVRTSSAVDWDDVVAVQPVRVSESWRVQLVTREGAPVTLPLPESSTWGVKRYERDYHQIGQWWRAHSVNATVPRG